MDPFPLCRNRTTELDLWREGATVADYVPERFLGSDFAVCIRNGKMLRPDEWPEVEVEFGDDLSFVELPGAYTGFIVVDAIITAAIAYGVTQGLNAFFGSPEAEQPFENAPDPTYTFGGIQNTASSGIPIPILYGIHKIGGNYIDIRLEGNNPYNSGQTFGNLLDVTIALCEGEVSAILETRINGNLISTYGSTVTQFALAGTGDQLTVGGGGAAATFAIGLELLDGGGNPYDPNTWTGGSARAYTTTQAVDRVTVNITHSRGLVHIDEQNGFYHPQGVNWQTRYKSTSTGTWEPWVQTHVVSNVTSPFTSQTEIIFPALDDYDVEVRKLSVVPQTQFFIDELELASITEIIDDGFTYPHTAVSRIRIEADRSLSGSLPTITHKLQGRKVQKWDGVSTSSPNFVDAAPYRNPAWIALDLLLNERYGLGRWWNLTNIDLESFLEWAEWCDELVSDGAGGLEERCMFDGVFDGANGSAWDRLLQIGATARASFVVVGDLLKVKVEKPRAPVQLFTMANIRESSWRQEWVSDTLRPTRFEIVYLNADRDYSRDDEGVDDEDAIAQGLPQRTKSISRMGITRRSQALREARFALNLFKLKQVISFEADIDAVTAEVGDLVQVAHDVPAWGFSGRLSADSADNEEVKLDRAVSIVSGESYEVIVRHPDDDKESLVVVASPGDYAAGAAIAVAAASEIPSKGSIYAFGRVNASTQTIKLTSITTNSDLSRSLSGIVYDERIHNDGIGILDTLPISELPDPGLVPACPSSLTASPLTSSSGGATAYGAKIAWAYPAGNVGGASVWYRDITGYVGAGTSSGDAFIQLASVTFPQAEATISTGLSLGSTYEFTVVVESATGASRAPGACGTATLEITGGTGPVPQSPTGFALSQSGDDLILSWQPVTNVPVSHYIVRRGVEWMGSREVGQTSSSQLITPRWAPTENSSIIEKFFVRGVSQSGDIGEVAALATTAGGLFIWAGGSATQSDESESGWPGSRTNLSIHRGSELELDNPDDPASYVADVIDTGSAGSYRIGAIFHATHTGGPGWGSGTWLDQFARQNGWLGYVDPDQWRTTYTLEFQASANNVAFSDWTPLVTQTVTGAAISGTWVTGMRYFRVRFTATPTDPTYAPIISQLYITLESR